MNCPYCNKEAKTSRGLIKHLTGTKKYGGHGFSVDEAQQILREGAVYVEEKEDRFAVPKNVHTSASSSEFGPQSKSDNAMTAKYRLLQARYRAEVLKEDYGCGPTKNRTTRYGNMLINGEETGRMRTAIKLSDLHLPEGRIGPFAGILDELRFYDYALSPEEVSNNFDAGADMLRIKAE